MAAMILAQTAAEPELPLWADVAANVVVVAGALRLLWVLGLRLAGRRAEVRPAPDLFPPWAGPADALRATAALGLAALAGYVLVTAVAAAFAGAGLEIAGDEGENARRFAFLGSDALGRLLGGCGSILVLTALLCPGGRRALGLTAAGLGRALAVGADGFLWVYPVCLLLAAVVTQFVESQQHQILKFLSNAVRDGRWDLIALLVFSAVVVAPLAEELFFRGLIQSGLRSAFARMRLFGARPPEPAPAFPVEGEVPSDAEVKPPPPPPVPPPPVEPTPAARWAAIAVSSLMFAVVHDEVFAWPTLFVLSAAMGRVFDRTGSLAAPIALHMLFNGWNIAMTLAQASGD
jgi:membrane protease YdiL (CAAX protease family)